MSTTERDLTLEGMAAFEASKRRKRHPAACHTAEPYARARMRQKRTPRPEPGQMALDFEAQG